MSKIPEILKDRKDLAEVMLLLRSHDRSIETIDACLERDSRDIITVSRLLERQERESERLTLVSAVNVCIATCAVVMAICAVIA